MLNNIYCRSKLLNILLLVLYINISRHVNMITGYYVLLVANDSCSYIIDVGVFLSNKMIILLVPIVGAYIYI